MECDRAKRQRGVDEIKPVKGEGRNGEANATFPGAQTVEAAVQSDQDQPAGQRCTQPGLFDDEPVGFGLMGYFRAADVRAGSFPLATRTLHRGALLELRAG